MNNQRIADTLDQLADLLEFTGANPFRLKAYRNGARVIRELTDSVAALLQANVDLTTMNGIGKSVAEKCQELVKTGKLSQLDEILQAVPNTVLDLLSVPKLGPKKAAALFNELGIANLEQLKTACEAGEVRNVAGFGEKTEAAILAGIAIAAAGKKRVLLAKANQWAGNLRKYFQDCPAVHQLEFAGSFRRGKETIGDLDILVTSESPEVVMEKFAKYDEIGEILARGETKMSVRNHDGFQIDLRVVPEESFGAAWQYFTGSKEHNVTLRGRAKSLGLKVNEWGVFNSETDERVAGKTEVDVYAALGLPWIPPELRENRHEFEWADQKRLPQLIELHDIVGDLHMHTVASDGKGTIEEMANAARQRGLQYIAITDHSQRVGVANGLNAQRLLAQWKEIDMLNRQAIDSFRILKGIECDILENGDLDLPNDVLAQADWVIASLHYGQSQPRQQITDRIVGAIENPHVDMIAHPTGRLLNQREAYEVDIEAVFRATQANQKKLELNSSPRRLDLNDVHLQAAKRYNIPIVINTDAHRTQGLDEMQFGVLQARRAGLTAQDVANTRSWQSLLGIQI
jgi:DNA polymerase (family 10)